MTKDEFITRRTNIISEMLDNPDIYEIYPTTDCFAALDDLYDELVSESQIQSWSQLNRTQYNG